uniref:SUEL-type lectin domain-containing protein n=1 Tax=Parascaris equorum TaxID=6256 RepID=A0A914SD12_PAREQ
MSLAEREGGIDLPVTCDGEKITLHCPRNTHILIENTFYGRLVPSTELCPSTAPNTFTLEDTSCDIAEAHASQMHLRKMNTLRTTEPPEKRERCQNETDVELVHGTQHVIWMGAHRCSEDL